MLSAARDDIRLDLPPMRNVADGHILKRHLADPDLEELKPVISMAG